MLMLRYDIIAVTIWHHHWIGAWRLLTEMRVVIIVEQSEVKLVSSQLLEFEIDITVKPLI